MKEFMRNNMFLVILTGAVLVLSIALLAAGLSASAGVSESIDRRAQIYQSVGNMKMVNEQMTAEQEKYNRKVEDEYKELEGVLSRQSALYEVPEVTDSQGGRHKAFPYNEAEYVSAGLYYLVTKNYVDEWTQRLKRLGRTSPPTEDDPYLRRQVRKWQRKFLDRKSNGVEFVAAVLAKAKAELEKRQRELGVEAPGTGGVRPEDRRPEGIEPLRPEYLREEQRPDELRGLRPWRGLGEPGAAAVSLESRIRLLNDIDQNSIPILRRQILAAIAMLRRIDTYSKELRQTRDPSRREELISALEDLERKELPTTQQRIKDSESTMRKRLEEVFALAKDASLTGALTGSESVIEAEADKFEFSPEVMEDVKFYIADDFDPADAETYGRRDARIASAKAGRIYVVVSYAALDWYYRAGQENPRPEDLWRMMINSWVTKDIVEAIFLTNNEVLKSLPPAEQNVINAAVKQLVAIDVDESYYHGAESQGRGYAPGSGATARERGRTLTGRVCNKEYDVVHYSFVVVMPTRHLQKLQANLMRDKPKAGRGARTATRAMMHTVRKVEMASLEQAARAGSRTSSDWSLLRRGIEFDPSMCFYGPEPVMAAKIYGELLLRTDWSRDLMPVAALKDQFPEKIRDTDRVLRPEDKKRSK